MSNNNTLQINPQAPIEELEKAQIHAIFNRIRSSLPDGHRMTEAHITTIAQESILYRTMPGKDIHYWVQDGKLQSSDDYKRLVAWAISRERFLTNDPEATIDVSYKDLSRQDRAREYIEDGDVAAYCFLTTRQEKEALYHSVRQWRELGFEPKEALDLARETIGELGTRAIGVVSQKVNKKGETYWKIPEGWSPLQAAQKLALKAVIRKKYGNPSIDELRAQTRNLTRVDTVEADWQDVPIDQPAEIQAKHAEINAIARQVKEAGEGMTIGERQGRAVEKVVLMRGDDAPIGEDEPIEGDFEVKPEEPQIVPDSPQKLLDFVNRRVEVPYDHLRHLLNAIKEHAENDNWSWPSASNTDGWRLACQHAKEHAESKTNSAPPVQQDIFEEIAND
jgi:N-glycosylase/DNA lyase